MITRFAPSPTGPLHLGHAYSALLAHDMATRSGGAFLLRFEDIDRTRARVEWEKAIEEDLNWLGISWQPPIVRQSDNTLTYNEYLRDLWQKGLLYPCSCNRRDIAAALEAPQEGVSLRFGPDGPVYPGTCRPETPVSDQMPPERTAMRLNIHRALAMIADLPPLDFMETGTPANETARSIVVPPDDMTQNVGDIVLSRKDFAGSYHLSVVLDDAAAGITHVIRGEDLFEATKIHVLLQRIFDLPTPVYHHHALVRDENGKRLAKRDDARAIAKYRAEGASPQDIRRMVGLPPPPR